MTPGDAISRVIEMIRKQRLFAFPGILALNAFAWAAAGGRVAAAPDAHVSPQRSSSSGTQGPLSPAESLRAFTLPRGFRIELFASEPLVDTPVAAAFDADGRLYVAEMRGYMHDVDGTDERAPNGRVIVLEDSDGDGRADKRTVFLDHLILPRGVGFAAGGVLIAAPPNLVFCRDENRDLVCDESIIIATDYGRARAPEDDDNGLLYGIDNWIYSAESWMRLRYIPGTRSWQREATPRRGHWGIAQDDWGRLFFNSSGDWLRGDTLPAYAPDVHLRKAPGTNVLVGKDPRVWPKVANAGVNRGYQTHFLDPDGKLTVFTAACGPTIYRGSQFPPQYHGNAFVAEPAANLVRRGVFEEDGDTLAVRNAYADSEFLTSTDPRFRPVNLMTGPDGALYVIDMYRGLFQQKIDLTPYLRAYTLEHKLIQPVDRGRIYRIVAEGFPLDGQPKMTKERSAGLVRLLAHPNGWWRDTAQRLLVEKQDRSIVRSLKRLVKSAPAARTRLHALFTLEGLGSLDGRVRKAAAADSSRFVRMAASNLEQRAAAQTIEAAARAATAGARLGMAALAGLAGHELLLVERLLADAEWRKETPERRQLFNDLAGRITVEARPARLLRLLDLVAAEPADVAWRQGALLTGVVAAVEQRGAPPPLPDRPQSWNKLTQSPDGSIRSSAMSLSSWVTGKRAPSVDSRQASKPLTPEEQVRYVKGKQLFLTVCAPCHQPSGLGDEGKGPPLVDSELVLGPPYRLALILLNGLHGPVEIGGRTYNFNTDMPSLMVLPDADLASVLTYVRREPDWGHRAPPVDPAQIVRARQRASMRDQPWTLKDLPSDSE